MPDSSVLSLPPPESLARWMNGRPFPPGGLYLVGGSIRDMLLGRPLKDLDLACKGAQAFAAALAQSPGARCVPLGQDHDPPSFRVVNLHDHDDFLDVTELAGPDITTDLARRDFTANAMALRLDNGVLIDPFNGRRDIHRGLLRRVGPSCLAQEPVRILRGFRLRAQLGWTITADTLSNMTAVASGLADVPGERLAPELRLILACPDAGRTIREMAHAGVLEALLPEMTPMRGCKQNRYHHLDVFEHGLAALECCDALLVRAEDFFGELAAGILEDLRGEPLAGWRLSWLKLAVLLHDLGKPGTRGLHPRTGQTAFHGHDALGARLALQVTRRLRLSRAESTYITNMIRHHLHVGALLTPQATTKAYTRLLRRLGTDMIPSVLLCLADTQATLGLASTPEFRRTKFEQGLRLLREGRESAVRIFSSPALLTGHDLIAMGVRPGPNLGRILKSVREAQDAGEVKNREQALFLAERIVKGPKNWPLPDAK